MTRKLREAKGSTGLPGPILLSSPSSRAVPHLPLLYCRPPFFLFIRTFCFQNPVHPPPLCSPPESQAPRSILGRRSCLAGPPGPEIGPISVPFFHPNAHLKDHQEGEGQGGSSSSITSTVKQEGGDRGGERKNEHVRGEISPPGASWAAIPQDFALPSP